MIFSASRAGYNGQISGQVALVERDVWFAGQGQGAFQARDSLPN